MGKKASQQTDKVRMVIGKIKTDGLMPIIETVFNKFDQPLTIRLLQPIQRWGIGVGVNGFEIGDRLISNGKHGKVVSISMDLCAKVPAAVTNEKAAFKVALQGIRLFKSSLGETFTGLGLFLLPSSFYGVMVVV